MEKPENWHSVKSVRDVVQGLYLGPVLGFLYGSALGLVLQIPVLGLKVLRTRIITLVVNSVQDLCTWVNVLVTEFIADVQIMMKSK